MAGLKSFGNVTYNSSTPLLATPLTLRPQSLRVLFTKSGTAGSTGRRVERE